MKLRAIPKHVVKGHCHCGLAVSIDVIREERFKCKQGHESEVADIVDDMTWKIANRKRAHAEMRPLPARTTSGLARPEGRHARIIQVKAATLVAALGKSQAKIQTEKLLQSAKDKQDSKLITYFQFLIAEIDAQ